MKASATPTTASHAPPVARRRVEDIVPDTSQLARNPERSNARIESGAQPLLDTDRSSFLTSLRHAITRAATDELAGTGWTAEQCPYIQYWFAYYEHRSAAEIEAALRRYAPATAMATTSATFIDATVDRVLVAISRWRSTADVDAPEVDVPAAAATMAELGVGEALDSATRTRFEAAMGEDLSNTRIHRDGHGAAMSQDAGARSFAIGNHVAFGSGQYAPGTPYGDAMLAHELAHTLQQRGATSAAGGGDSTLETGADRSAFATMGRLWRGLGDTMLGPRTAPQHAGGLRLQRCPDKSSAPTPTPAPPTPTPTPSPPKPPWVKPAVSVSMTSWDKGFGMQAVQATDVAAELAYEQFELREDYTAGTTKYPKQTVVRPTAWDNAASTITVLLDSDPKVTFAVPKWNLRPVPVKAKGLATFNANTTSLDKQAEVVKKGVAAVAQWDKDKPLYKKNPGQWAKDRGDAAKALAGSEAALNVFEIQQFMFNRFDPMIVAMVDDANTRWGTPKDPLDPNIVKSIIFRETQMGTSGSFMDDTSARQHHLINHWNITQAIDSSGEMYARYFLKEDPARVAKFKIQNIMGDKVRAEAAAPKDTFVAEEFFWAYPGLSDAIEDLWKSGTPRLNNTFEHWIFMLLFELFQKRRSAKDWDDAVRRYNGSGPKAEKYRKEVMERYAAMREALKAGKPYVPRHGED